LVTSKRATDSGSPSSKITPFLWFDDKAEEAMKFYVSIFKNSKIISVTRTGPGKKGEVMSGIFRLDGQESLA
jgi:predicted 3-demethylubiquinone-9 3-methyltransferase (glyoxalase superfamily)